MEKIKIIYGENIDLTQQLQSLISKFTLNDEYEFQIIFNDEEGNEVKDYANLESYKLLTTNLQSSQKVIKSEKIEINKLIEKIKAKVDTEYT